MCEISDKIKFCTCSSDVENLKHYWVLHRKSANLDEMQFCVGTYMMPNEKAMAFLEINTATLENRLNEAQKRLAEAQKQLNQAHVVISDIKSETLSTKKVMLKADAVEARNDLKFRFERAVIAFKSKERRIFFEIKEQITSLVLTRTVSRVKETFAQDKAAAKLINNTIRTLELP